MNERDPEAADDRQILAYLVNLVMAARLACDEGRMRLITPTDLLWLAEAARCLDRLLGELGRERRRAATLAGRVVQLEDDLLDLRQRLPRP
jgi:hypothetical protein